MSRPFIQVGVMTDPRGTTELITLIAIEGDKMIVTQMEPTYAAALGKRLLDAADVLARKPKVIP